MPWGWSLGSGGSTSSSNTIATSQPQDVNYASVAGPNPPPNAPGTGQRAGPPPTGNNDPGGGGGIPVPAQQQAPTGPVATGNPGNDPTRPPNAPGNWHFQGGRWVDATYQHDATGRQLTPDETAAARQYDTNRAQAASIRRSNDVGGSSSNNPALSGMDYDPNTKQWVYYDTKAKAWTPGKSLEDIYNTLFTDTQRSAHPLFYYQQQAADTDYSQLRHSQYEYQTAQANALSGTPTTRYAPVRF
jgi:hypothetical protein